MMRTGISIILVFVFCVSVTFARRIHEINLRATYDPSSTAGLNQAPTGTVSGYGTVIFSVENTNQFVYVETTIIVPPKQAHKGTLFLWPGLQPGGANFYPIDNGVLQPVLTWGPSCAPGTQPAAYSTWWISAQYVNTYGKLPGYTDCNGGRIMSVNPGDQLCIKFQLRGTDWTQTVTNRATNMAVTFSINMRGQAQNNLYFIIEQYSSTFVDDVVYLNSSWQFAKPSNNGCNLSSRGMKDFVSTPRLSADKLSCSVAKIIQRAQENPRPSF
ncbi:unnamed protein product [Rotaria sp. Silwood2]|nr:unnamed protein product [Rotaria sp. Silwood2]